MIFTRLQGGLGNQLFQYAIGRALADLNNTKLLLDISGFKHHYNEHVPRSYMLDVYPIEASIATQKQLNTLKNGTFLNRIGLKRNKHYKQLVFDEIPPKQSHYKFTDLFVTPYPTRYYPEIMTIHKTKVVLDGYWQSFRFFDMISDKISDHFKCNDSILNYNESVLDMIYKTESVSVHYRRTDRVNTKADLKNFNFLDSQYYNNTINVIENHIRNPHYFIFSDDIKWCKENVKLDYPTTFVEGNNEFSDLFLMATCKHNIIAHSTFSWWAAWLNKNKHKLVVCPKLWFSKQSTEDIQDMIPKQWIMV